MPKAEGAFRTIGELAQETGIPQHVLRYWEGRFPQLRPLQRSGNRRYYRPDDVALVRRIQRLLGDEGYTVRGVQKLLERGATERASPATETSFAAAVAPQPIDADQAPLAALRTIRERLVAALEADAAGEPAALPLRNEP